MAEPVSPALIRMQLRAAIEKAENLQPIDDPGPFQPEFDFDPAFYVQCALYRHFDPHKPPMPGFLPLQQDLCNLIAEVRLLMQRRRISAIDTKAFIPDAMAPTDSYVYFRLGAYVFLAHACPDKEGEGHLLGVIFNVDPDAIDDADD